MPHVIAWFTTNAKPNYSKNIWFVLQARRLQKQYKVIIVGMHSEQPAIYEQVKKRANKHATITHFVWIKTVDPLGFIVDGSLKSLAE